MDFWYLLGHSDTLSCLFLPPTLITTKACKRMRSGCDATTPCALTGHCYPTEHGNTTWFANLKMLRTHAGRRPTPSPLGQSVLATVAVTRIKKPIQRLVRLKTGYEWQSWFLIEAFCKDFSKNFSHPNRWHDAHVARQSDPEMPTLGFEPRLSRPQRDVLITRRCRQMMKLYFINDRNQQQQQQAIQQQFSSNSAAANQQFIKGQAAVMEELPLASKQSRSSQTGSPNLMSRQMFFFCTK